MSNLINSLECEYCKKIFSTKSNCTKHKNICKIKKQTDIKDNQHLKDIITQKDDIIRQKDEQINFLKTMLDKYTNKPNIINYNNSNNTINNNLSIKQLVSKLDPINFKDIKDYMNNYSVNYQDEGTKGFAKFLCEYPFKDKFITTDFARNTIAYKTNDNNFIRDPESTYLINQSIKQNKNDVMEKAYNRLEIMNSHIKRSEDEDETEEYCSKKINIKKFIDATENIDSNTVIDKDVSNVFRNSGVITYQKLSENEEYKNSIEV
jgi:hypothetical protein